MRKYILILGCVSVLASTAYAQQNGHNPLSLRPIHASDAMYKKTITRALDLREKQNSPLFSRNKEITVLLIEGVTKGMIKAYENDSLQKQLTKEDFLNKLRTPSAMNVPTDTVFLFLEYGPEWRTIIETSKNERYFARDLYQLEIKEDVLFDKQHSKMVHDILAITIYIPADHPMNEKGIQIPLASFGYKELVEHLFRDNPKAIWYNTQNEHEHKTLADAFELRLFSSYIIKVANPADAYLTDLHSDPHKGIMASKWAAYELMESEHHLWEF
ncbi:MAG TPA: gliding motility protein GldN [Cytophagaceae bacterium]|jgi:gliding motility associated protien GldN|nr:gliding motility protein GldN [Cytophagaceae bacterium]